MMVPQIRTVGDIETVLKYLRRWRKRNRVLTLRACKEQIDILVQRKDVTPSQIAPLRWRVLTQLAIAKRLLKKDEQAKESAMVPEISPGEIPLITKQAMALVKEHKLPATELKGTGKDGRVVLSDVREYMANVSQ